MRVGDTVRRTTHNMGGLRVGDTYVVSAFEPRLNGVSVEGHAEMFAAEFFEVVREAPEPVDVVELGGHNSTTVYTAIIQGTSRRYVVSHLDEQMFNNMVNGYLAQGATVLKQMKVRVQI